MRRISESEAYTVCAVLNTNARRKFFFFFFFFLLFFSSSFLFRTTERQFEARDRSPVFFEAVLGGCWFSVLFSFCVLSITTAPLLL